MPAENSDACLVRVTSEASGNPFDVSDGPFRILPPGLMKPDLMIVAASLVPSNANPNGSDTISVDVAVRNDGNAASGLFFVDLFYDRTSPPAPGEVGDQTVQCALATGLDPGGGERSPSPASRAPRAASGTCTPSWTPRAS